MKRKLRNSVITVTIASLLLGMSSCTSTSRASTDKPTPEATTVNSKGVPELTDEQIAHFTCEIMQSLYSKESNMSISPANLYIILGMLTEITDGDSYNQICELLQTEDINTIRDEVNKLMNTSNQNTSFANSLWKSINYSYKEEAESNLAEYYLSESYSVNMGTEEANDQIHNWINERTNNMLKEAAEKFNTNPDTILALVSAIYFNSNWETAFPSREEPYIAAFKTSDGNEIDIEYMSDKGTQYPYFVSDSFEATYKELDDGNLMWFILPNEEYSPEEILNSEDFEEFLSNENKKQILPSDSSLYLTIPKFDISSFYELENQLSNLGITNIFNPNKSDFSKITDDSNLYVNEFVHASRIMIDEEGVTAAAFSSVGIRAYDTENNDKYLTFNRPFIYMVTSSDNTSLPLFAGVVNNPTSQN